MKIIAALCLIALTACGDTDKVKPQPKFQPGEMVTIKITGEKGMVIYSQCYRGEKTCRGYQIRMAGINITTNTRLLSKDDPVSIKSIMTYYFKEFELE